MVNPLGRDRSKLPESITGVHWGLLPAVIAIPYLSQGGLSEEGYRSWLVFWAALMAAYDVADRRIPNPLTMLAAVFGLTWSYLTGGLAGLLDGTLGGLLGFGLMAVFFFMGAVGGGDVKAIGALATLLTPKGALLLFVLTTLVGGVLAVGRIIGGGTKSSLLGGLAAFKAGQAKKDMPYGLAILGGAIVLSLIGGRL